MSDQASPPPGPPAQGAPAGGVSTGGSYSPVTIGGCSLMLIFLMAAAIFGIRAVGDDDDDEPCAGDGRALAAGSLAGLSAGSSCPRPSTSDGADQTPDPSPDPSDDPSDDPSEDPSEVGATDGPLTSADLPDDGVGLPGDVFAPPAEEDLPEGAVLYTGSSGDPIGCITCDGGSRFLSIEHPGVVVGDVGMTSQATSWPEAGQILEFGANLSGPNKGRYGFNVFNGPTTYLNGCSMEIGSTSCLQAREAPHVEKGMPLVIIIGEGGTMKGNQPASRGDFVVDWWFVFQPD